MHRWWSPKLKVLAGWAAVVAAGLTALVLAVVLAVALFDWNLAKPWVLARVAAVIARPVQVDGTLQLSWAGWMQLRLQARQVAIGNADWADSGPWLARASAVDLQFSPLDLLHKQWTISALQLSGLQLTMERGADGRKNWRFTQEPQPRWHVDIARLDFERAHIRYVDRPVDLDLSFDVTPASRQPAQATPATQAQVSGRWHQARVSAQAQGGPLLALLDDGAVFPLRATGEVGQVKAQVDGNFTNPRRLQRADLKLELAGASLAELYASTGVPLPQSQPFRTEGMLAIVRVGDDPGAPAWDWHYQDFSGTVGESDFAGDVHFLKGVTPRPRLRATLQSRQLRMADLLPGQDKEKDKPQVKSRTGRLLSERPLQSARWDALDAELAITAARVQLSPGMRWQDAHVKIELKDKRLSAAPLRFGMAGGQALGSLVLDGRQQPLQAQLKLNAQGLQLKQLFPRLAGVQASFGALEGHASLTGRGDSVAALLGSANGRIEAATGAGTISQFILEAAGLNLADAIFARLYRDRQVKLHCAVADIRVEQGRAHIARFMLNTEESVVGVSGQVDLGQETLDLDVTPKNKRLRVLSLTTPLHVSGRFSDPQLAARGSSLAARAGGAAVLALVAPVAAIVPLITPGEDLPDDCQARHSPAIAD